MQLRKGFLARVPQLGPSNHHQFATRNSVAPQVSCINICNRLATIDEKWGWATNC